MKIFLENLYHSDCYFLPIRDNQQVLVGVELITHFSSEDGTVRIPTSRVIAQLKTRVTVYTIKQEAL